DPGRARSARTLCLAATGPLLARSYRRHALGRVRAAGSARPDAQTEKPRDRSPCACADGRSPALLLGLLAREDGCPDQPASDPPERLGRERPHAAIDERQARPAIVGVERKGSEDLPAEPAGPDTVARVAGAAVDHAVDRSEEPQGGCGDVGPA